MIISRRKYEQLTKELNALRATNAELVRQMYVDNSRPEGEWKNIGFMVCECNKCKEQFHELEVNNYCPNCGADMRGNKETTFYDYLKEQLKDPEFRKEWEKLSEEEESGADIPKPNCVTCDHFGECDGCERRNEE